jgi:hypothetical protein
MAEHEGHRQRVQRLLAQDHDITATRSEEFRMNLEAALSNWEQRAERIRRWLVRSIVILVAAYLGLIFSTLGYGPGQAVLQGTALGYVYNAIQAAFFLGILASMCAAGGLAIAYFAKYAPGLRRARFDVHTAMILELQEQMAELRAHVEGRGKT